MKRLLLLCLPALGSLLAASACGDSSSTTATTSSSSHASSSGATSTSGGGASTTATTTSSHAASSGAGGQGGQGGGTSSAGGAGGSGGCPNSYVDLTVDNGAPMHLTAECLEDPYGKPAMGATGYVLIKGGKSNLDVYGCQTADQTLGTFFQIAGAMPLETTLGSVGYRDATTLYGVPGDTIDVKVTKVDAVGGMIEGTFTATLSDTMAKQPQKQLSATFHVCRAPDVMP